MDHITLAASDNVHLVGLYNPGRGERGALFLHMMPAAKESWGPLLAALAPSRFHLLAIDFRGHGGSDGGPEGYREFGDADHQASIHDVEAGMAFLARHGARPEHTAIVGASIGANLALWYAADHPKTPTLVLLSPGLNYRGIETLPLAARLPAETRALLASSEDDNENLSMCRTLAAAMGAVSAKRLIEYHAAGHGTDMFGTKEEPDLVKEITAWVDA